MAASQAPEAPEAPDPIVFVLFGATGDLARRLVLPSFFRLALEGLLPAEWRLIGSGRRRKTDDEFRDDVHAALEEFGSTRPADGPWHAFSARLRFAGGGFTADDPGDLLDRIGEARDEIGADARLVHYLGLPPQTFADYTRAIGAHGVAEGARVVYEKPFGTSLEGFRALDEVVHDVLDESQVFRIDHFLGKEATQELRALRFANGLFGSSWDRHHVAAVQIDVPETLDVRDRAQFYDSTGAALDMLVTHLFQVAAEVAMEPPASLDADDVSEARAEAVRAFRPLTRDEVVRGQFDGYRDIPDVAADSTTETFVAARLWIDSERWRGVPFLLRTGKRMAASHQKVNLVFRDPEDCPLPEGGLPHRGNVLCFDLAGDGALALSMNVKTPGATMELGTAWTQIPLDSLSGGDPLPPYTRLIHDVLLGDRALFTRPDGLEDVWIAAADVLDDHRQPEPYEPGSWGPKDAQRLAEPVGWVLPG
ncbi:glucose-6-phosphate dehydrogenase [Actinomycetospora cinnamomea]|uniref:Glucose-6-phosphate 1-dehydrogenase n=1 Tax=Actinomycetospora cinnamomea TaxID=663609 RepID=A0A2U1FA75_9PSEU|nr:glucose-6-phosphate dehydrogenase (NADP(+)) [Actinomycetospora cinnamomea]PVZ09076.1 glucose-6-phosphate 1-dehydrogenase [Actinomycetospora cinnamomea]